MLGSQSISDAEVLRKISVRYGKIKHYWKLWFEMFKENQSSLKFIGNV